MKFKFIGENDSFCIELLAYKLVPNGQYLKKGDVIDVPDDLEVVVNSLNASGQFIKVQDKKTVKKGDK